MTDVPFIQIPSNGAFGYAETKDPRADMATHALVDAGGQSIASILGSGPLSARPAASTANTNYYYFATDTNQWYQSTGTTWVARTPISADPTRAPVASTYRQESTAFTGSGDATNMWISRDSSVLGAVPILMGGQTGRFPHWVLNAESDNVAGGTFATLFDGTDDPMLNGMQIGYGSAGAAGNGFVVHGNFRSTGVNQFDGEVNVVEITFYPPPSGAYQAGMIETASQGIQLMGGKTNPGNVGLGAVIGSGEFLNDIMHQIASFQEDGGGGVSICSNGQKLRFYDTNAGTAKQTVVGAKGGNVALANLLTALVNLGLITDNTT